MGRKRAREEPEERESGISSESSDEEMEEGE